MLPGDQSAQHHLNRGLSRDQRRVGKYLEGKVTPSVPYSNETVAEAAAGSILARNRTSTIPISEAAG
jgi:hypothetical protein